MLDAILNGIKIAVEKGQQGSVKVEQEYKTGDLKFKWPSVSFIEQDSVELTEGKLTITVEVEPDKEFLRP